jgi:hypothetical protein
VLTRKDFETFASSIKKLADTNRDAAYEMACDTADYCKSCNPRFDRLRFFEACGFPGGMHLRPLPVRYVEADDSRLR